jgi:(2Fe-2S) ferredoxin
MSNQLFLLWICVSLLVASCGTMSKMGQYKKANGYAKVDSTVVKKIVNETFTKGDSVVYVSGSTLQGIVPLNTDTNNATSIDSIISSDVKVYVKTVYYTNSSGKQVLKGVQVNAVTPSKTIKAGYTQITKSQTNEVAQLAKSTKTKDINVVKDKKRDSRLGSIIAILILILLLGGGLFIANIYFKL